MDRNGFPKSLEPVNVFVNYTPFHTAQGERSEPVKKETSKFAAVSIRNLGENFSAQCERMPRESEEGGNSPNHRVLSMYCREAKLIDQIKQVCMRQPLRIACEVDWLCR